jgi:hypothetical protein
MRPLIAFAATAAFVFSTGVTSSPANAKEYAAKYMGSKALAATCARGGGSFHQSTAVSHSCKYKNGNTRDCSSKSKTCVVITPDKARVRQATGVGGVPTGGGAVYATTTLKCKGENHEVSTGTNGGHCIVEQGKSVVCNDGPKNRAGATCASGCSDTDGAGSCKTASTNMGTPPKPPRPRGKPGVAVIPPAGKSIVDRGGILDSGPGFGSQGPAATGAPLSTGRGSAPPPGQIK